MKTVLVALAALSSLSIPVAAGICKKGYAYCGFHLLNLREYKHLATRFPSSPFLVMETDHSLGAPQAKRPQAPIDGYYMPYIRQSIYDSTGDVDASKYEIMNTLFACEDDQYGLIKWKDRCRIGCWQRQGQNDTCYLSGADEEDNKLALVDQVVDHAVGKEEPAVVMVAMELRV